MMPKIFSLSLPSYHSYPASSGSFTSLHYSWRIRRKNQTAIAARVIPRQFAPNLNESRRPASIMQSATFSITVITVLAFVNNAG